MGSVSHCVDSGYCIGGEEAGWYLISTSPLSSASLQWFPLFKVGKAKFIKARMAFALPDAEKLEQVTKVQNRKLAGRNR